MKKQKKSKWQIKREKNISKKSQFDPEIHDLSREGEGFHMKKNYKEKPGELAGSTIKHLLDKWK